MTDIILKTCTKCEVTISSDNFGFNRKTKDGFTKWCKKCMQKSSVSYKRNNPEKVKEFARNSSLKIKYGLNVKEYNEILLSQNNSCAICGVDATGCKKAFHVDHDHKSGKIKGLLCHSCNVLLGFAKDNIDILKKSIKYLRK